VQGNALFSRTNRQLAAVLRLCLVLVAVGALTWVDFRLARVNSSTAAFTYLLLILGLATQIGRAESVAASLASMLAYNFFFLPPVGTLSISDPENWITLLSFVVAAVTTSHLSSTVRTRAEQAAAGQQQVQRMYDFSRGLMLTDETGRVAERAAHQLVTAFGADAASVFTLKSGIVISEGPGSPFTADLMRQVSDTGEPWFDEPRSASIVPIRFGGRPLGSLAVAGAKGTSEVALYAITQLVGAELERAQAQDAAARMLAARESEHLKSVLLDALAHEFKTPLTSIKAAATSMLSQGHLDGIEQELATVIDEEADRLTTLVSDAIELARVGSAMVQLQRETWSARDLVESAAEVFARRLEDRELSLECEPDLPAVSADRKLAEIALRQLLVNALLYSPQGTAIQIKVWRKADFVAIGVQNAGPAIPAAEQKLLFEKFYRGENARGRVAGSGMGLNIARDIAAAHGGEISVENRVESGVQFWFTLPLDGTPISSSSM
jgi:two-component system, OmpR family, sensor histidine kinase KdpD